MSAFDNALNLGSKVSNYEIRRVLGEGAFGITYLARNSLGQERTIKEFFPAGHVTRNADGEVEPLSADKTEAYSTARARFRDEAKIVAGLEHPHIVSGLDFFDANNTAYFVMPYYDGMSLDRFIVGGDMLEPDEARHLLDRLWSALDYLHAKNIFHRDIKPANIFIVDETGEPILLDFGAARISDTGTQMRVGTDHYRAPEQTTDNGDIGPWTDIYGLAATVYRMISGNFPADAATRLSAIADGDADPLVSLSGNAQLTSNFGKNFLGAIESGLKLKTQDRPQTTDGWKRLFAGSRQPVVEPQKTSAPAVSSDTFAQEKYFEPEGTPWLRYGVLGLFLATILAGGAYLAINAIDWKKPGTEQTASVEPETPKTDIIAEDEEPAPTATKRLSRSEAWVRALELDSLEGYREYLSLFSTGDNADKARAEIRRFDDEAFAQADRTGTIPVYQSYLDQFPSGAHVTEANSAMQAIRNARAAANRKARQEMDDWQTAASTNTQASYQAYLDKHPGGKNAPEAQRRLAEFAKIQADTNAFNQAKTLGTKTAFQTYLNSYPQGKHVPEAMAAIDGMTPRVGGKIKDCATCPSLTILATGGFQQGASPGDGMARSNEKPERRVDFAQVFAIGVNEVTFSEWDACVAAGGCTARPNDQGWGRGNRPVINVTWSDARGYTEWLSKTTGEVYSLPSESQWEYAARAGETRPWLGGSTQGVCVFANGAGKETGANWANMDCSDPTGDRTMPVGTLAANKFGLKDVLGNVAEWTMDCNTLNYRDAPSNGMPDMRGSCRQRVTRGGSWFAGPRDLRLSARSVLRQGDSNDFTGFRVVRAVKQ